MEYFVNEYTEVPEDILESIRETLELYVLVIKSNAPLGIPKAQTSTGQLKSYSGLYIGYGGKLFTTWKLSQAFNDYYEDFESMKKVVKDNMDQLESDSSTFFMGKLGILSILAVSQQSGPIVREILDSVPLTFKEFELLYGAAGTLFVLGFLIKHWPDVPFQGEIVQKIKIICKEIVDKSERRDIIMHKFPNGSRGKYYLGAAHGIMGIVHVMLQVRAFIPEYEEVIRSTIEFILSFQRPSGNFPVAVNRNEDDTLHFCHGSPGAIPLLCLAYKCFNDPIFLESALKAGEDLWTRGLLRKGRGLCHGVSGNGYSFLALYSATNDSKWLDRARLFAYIMGFDEDYEKSVRSYTDPQRHKQGEPDFPYSLMEGLSGSVCYLQDCLEPSNASFPGYDL